MDTQGALQRLDDSDFEAALYDPQAVVEHLTIGVRSPLKLAPLTVTDKIVALIQNPEELYALFEHVAQGKSLAGFSKKHDLSYLAVMALYESPVHPFISMRKIAAKAVSREDRDRARAAVRRAKGRLDEDASRYASRMLDLAKSEDPDQFTATPKQNTTVNVAVGFGEALGSFHREKTMQRGRAAVTIEQSSDSGIEDLL